MKKIVVGCFMAAMTVAAQADLIALWNNDSLQGTNQTAAATSLGANLDSAELARGAGGTPTTYANTFAMRNAHSASLEYAVTSNRFLTMSLVAEAGYTMSLTNVFIRLQAQNATDYAVSFTLFSGQVGYNLGDELVTWTVGGTGNSADWLGQPRSFDLSGVTELQGVEEADFRLYVWGQDGGSFAQTGIGRAFQTNGDTDLEFTGSFEVVPEPGTLGLMGLGMLGMAFARRRRNA